MENRKISNAYKKIAKQIIESKREFKILDESGVDIIYLVSDHEKKKQGMIVFADCEKVPDKWKWAVPADFIITVYEPHAALLDDEQKMILLYHELLHVGVEEDYSMRGFRFFVRPHDIEDFETILAKYGINWNKPRSKKK